MSRYRTKMFFLQQVLVDDLITPKQQRICANTFWEFSMKSPVVKRSVVIDGHKTSVSLEHAFWSDLKEIAYMEQVTLSELVTKIDKGRQAATCLQRYACSYSTKSVRMGTCGDILLPRIWERSRAKGCLASASEWTNKRGTQFLRRAYEQRSAATCMQ